MNQRFIGLWMALALCVFGVILPASLPAFAAAPAHRVASAQAKAPTFFTCVWNGQTTRVKHIKNVSIENYRDAVRAGSCTKFKTNDKYYGKLIGKSINTWVAWREYPNVFVVHNGAQGRQPVLGAWTFAIGAQSPAVVHGVISDKSTGSPIAGATITATYCVATPTKHCVIHSIQTDSKGAYLIRFDVSGSYKIVITADGYATPATATVKGTPGRNVNRNFKLTAAPTPVTLALTALPATASTTTPVTLTATIDKPVSDGTVTFTGTGPAGATFTSLTCTPVAGVCSVSWTPPAGGAWSISASWSGDSKYAAANGTAQITVSGQQTTLLLTSSPANPGVNQSVTLTAALGQTTLSDGTTTFTASGPGGATASIPSCVPAAGVCSVTWLPTTAGLWTVTAKWSGDGAFAAVTGSTQVTVAQGSATLSLAVNPTSPIAGTQAQLTATISPPVNDGTVTFTGIGPAGATLANTPCTPSGGTCSVAWSTSVAGSWTITASWSGDTNYGATTKSTQVTIRPSVIVVTLSPTSPNVGQQALLHAQLAQSVSDGSVTFAGSGPNGATFPTITCQVTNGACIANWTPSVVGTWTITGSWSGDTTLPAGSTTGQVTVGQGGPTIAITPSATPLPANQTASLRAVLSVPANDGSITFTGTGPNNATFAQQSCTPVQGACSITWPASAAGNWSITATWPGDSQYQSATSTAQIAVGIASSINLSFAPASPVVNHPVTATATLGQSQTGGTVTFTAVGPNGATISAATCTPVNSTCTATLQFAQSGTWQVTGSWGGGGLYAPASQNQTLTVNPQGFLSITESPNPLTVNATGNVTATLGQPITDGTVTFSVSGPNGTGATIPSSCTPANGTCTVTFKPAVAGVWTISGFWSGLTHASASDSTQVNVTGTATTLTLTNSPTNATTSQTSTLTAHLSQTVSDGTISFTATGPNGVTATIPNCTPANGTCTVNWQPTTSGTWTVTGSWTGDTLYQSSSATITITVYNGNLALTSNPAQPVANQAASVTGLLTQGSNISDGTITFQFSGPGGATYPNQSCGPINSTCSVSWTPSTNGNWTITATWQPGPSDTTYQPTTNAITVTVGTSSGGGSGTFISVSVSPSPAHVGQSVNVTLTAAQADSGGDLTFYITRQDLTLYGSIVDCGAATTTGCHLTIMPDMVGTWSVNYIWTGSSVHPEEDRPVTFTVS